MAYDGYIGKHVSVTLSDGSTFSSDLFAVDTASGLLAFRQEPAHTYMKADYRFVPTSAITALHSVDGVAARPVPSFLDVTAADLEARRKEVHSTVEKLLSTRGVGVSSDAQMVFDGVNKQLPCRWHGDNIIVTDAVVIAAPYGESNISLMGDVDAAVFGETLKRVRMLVGRIRANRDASPK